MMANKTLVRGDQQYQGGIVLIEALIAILIFSIGILGVVGLQAAMISGTAEARYRTEATYIAQQRISSMWVDQANVAAYLEADTDIAASGLPGGRRSTVRQVGDAFCVADPTCFTVVVSWQSPGSDDVHNVTLTARVTGG